eukprot:TRINITY_DN16678_c0_g1_i1.p1 TRINITY_DN16678_c0_g1~~TRINITY_DN16678_c0_g1_i1.p1  ORF type:complete len:274 (+),score=57.38 TRINITY_DN16678_c0_g1_i1:18-839(+)
MIPFTERDRVTLYGDEVPSSALLDSITSSGGSVSAVIDECFVKSQQFTLFDGDGALLSQNVCDSVRRLVLNIQQKIINNKLTVFIFSGAGTSGRLAHFVSRSLPSRSNVAFRYTIAGGDNALIAAQEGAEDSAIFGVADLKKIFSEFKEPFSVVYIGITCGMSAPYIAGQIEYFLRDPDRIGNFDCVLMGFNPIIASRTNPIEGIPVSPSGAKLTFLDVAKSLEKRITNGDERFHLVNPIYGPEVLTGSTRMTGGTITKILLDTICFSALQTG